MDYSPFNPFVWTIFFGCAALVYLTVKVYHRKHPYYPYDAKGSERPRSADRRAAIRRISGAPIGATNLEAGESAGLNDIAEL